MLHGTTPDAAALADSAVILSVIRGLIAKRVIDHIDARLWMDNAISMIQEDKNVTRDASRRYDLGSPLFQINIQYVGHEDCRRITWAAFPPSELKPFCEDDFSLFAVCRAS